MVFRLFDAKDPKYDDLLVRDSLTKCKYILVYALCENSKQDIIKTACCLINCIIFVI